MAVAQIIFRDLPDGRVEIALYQRDLYPAAGPSAALVRIALAALGAVIDLRAIGEGLALGKPMIVDKVLPFEIGYAFTKEGCEDIALTSDKIASA